ncbi:YchJ family protein [Ottowia thiooxydans]|uniref:YchJ family protein n=1 Tax=Ottowia thiooxydans TaxID=219182 RepID=UPI003F4FB5C5
MVSNTGAKRVVTQEEICACGGHPAGKSFDACCGRWITNYVSSPAPDAQALMRSRYSGFVREDASYLLATWHPSTRPGSIDFDRGVKWLGLEVRSHLLLDAGHAEVEFVARSRFQGRATRLHELSRFKQEEIDGMTRWFYLDGVIY